MARDRSKCDAVLRFLVVLLLARSQVEAASLEDLAKSRLWKSLLMIALPVGIVFAACPSAWD